jgi:hypothetical protein
VICVTQQTHINNHRYAYIPNNSLHTHLLQNPQAAVDTNEEFLTCLRP